MAIMLKSKSAQEQVKEQVLSNWRKNRDDRSELEETWKRCLMAYLCKFDKRWANYAKQAGRSCRYVGVSFDAVETWVPQVYDAILGRDEAIALRPMREGMDNTKDDQLAEDMKYLLRFQMEHGKYRRTMQQAMKSLGILGNCPWWMDWQVKTAVNYDQFSRAMEDWMAEAADYQEEYGALIKEHQMMSIQMSLLGQEAPPPPNFTPPPQPPKDVSVIFQGPVLRIGSIFNYVQEQHPNDEASAIRIIRSFRTLKYLEQMAKPDESGYAVYENLKNVAEVTGEDRVSDNEAEALLKMALGMQMPTGQDKVEIKEQQGTFEIASGPEAGIYENWIAVVANETLVRCEPTPMFSGKLLVHNARLNVLPGAVYGIGILEKALDEQDSVNAIHNQNIDAVNCVIQPEMEVVLDNVVDGIVKPSGPGQRHEVTEHNTFNPIRKDFSGLQVGFAAVEASIGRHERMTGAINTAGGSRESATRTARNANVIATKLGGAVEAVEEDLISEALNMAMEMNAQYMPDDDDVVFSITQDKRSVIKKISPRDIRRGWLVRVAGSKYLAEKQERVQNLMMASQIAGQRAASGTPSPIREDELYRRLFKEVLGDSDGIVMTAEEYKELMVQYQSAQAAAQMGAAQVEQQQQSGQAGEAGGGPVGAPAGGPAGAA